MTRIMFLAVLTVALAGTVFGLTTISVNPGGGGDYTSLYDAEANLPATLDDDYWIQCSGSTDDTKKGVLVNVTTLNGATQYTLLISGDNVGATFDDTKYNLKPPAAVDQAITVTSNYVTLRNLQITGNSTRYNGIYITGTNCTVDGCLIQDFTRAAMAGINLSSLSASSALLVTNNVIWNCTRGIYDYRNQHLVYNNTIVSPATYGILINRGSAAFAGTYKNNLISGSPTSGAWGVESGDSGTLVTATNYTADATSPDADCNSVTITFVGGEDFHLDSSMENTLLGTDLSVSFTVDIDDESRSNWYAGADEYISENETLIPIFMHHYRSMQ